MHVDHPFHFDPRGRTAATTDDDYLRDLAASVAEVRQDPSLAKSGSAPMYGMAAKMPIRGFVASRVRKVMADMYSRGAQP